MGKHSDLSYILAIQSPVDPEDKAGGAGGAAK